MKPSEKITGTNCIPEHADIKRLTLEKEILQSKVKILEPKLKHIGNLLRSNEMLITPKSTSLHNHCLQQETNELKHAKKREIVLNTSLKVILLRINEINTELSYF